MESVETGGNIDKKATRDIWVCDAGAYVVLNAIQRASQQLGVGLAVFTAGVATVGPSGGMLGPGALFEQPRGQAALRRKSLAITFPSA